ncbi:Holliday junction branch migration protein RuvA [Candidatus Nomurabacteria bacterium]|nr:Holliday junction branch migration protein RuvA [Candidatus Nomurabacteria bacterium]MCB9803546.1 Holliday junction branch migration protein RuvA [Candidatus Nomurabacteria bacterium]
MIVQLKGIVSEIRMISNLKYLDLITVSGVGYRVTVPANEFPGAKGEVVVYTSMQVREDSQTLYGFERASTRDFFEILIGVSGIGPKIGISILATYPEEKVKQLILETDHKSLSKVSGLGPKGAKKIILELAGELSSVNEEEADARNLEMIKDMKQALRTLGFKGEEMESMVKKAHTLLEEDMEMNVEDLLAQVLRG